MPIWSSLDVGSGGDVDGLLVARARWSGSYTFLAQFSAICSLVGVSTLDNGLEYASELRGRQLREQNTRSGAVTDAATGVRRRR